MTDKAKWVPKSSGQTAIRRFMEHINKSEKTVIETWEALYHFSVTEFETFWRLLFDFGEFNYSGNASEVIRYLSEPEQMFQTEWFSSVKLNFAQNLLIGDPDKKVLVCHAEGATRKEITLAQLRNEVVRAQSFLQEVGVKKGDRVSGVLVNGWHAIVAMLATSSLGAIWSSCSPDFGLGGVCDRLSQIDSKILFLSESYFYGGKRIDCTKSLAGIGSKLPTLKGIVLCNHVTDEIDMGSSKEVFELENTAVHPDLEVACVKYSRIGRLSKIDARGNVAPYFEKVSFSAPLYIMFSSGTTGMPKCIVHSVGGTLLQHYKEHALHCDLTPKDTLFYFTTCGWMMWNWMVSALKCGTRIMTYDGSLMNPDADFIFNLAKEENVTVFGTSPKFLSICESNGFKMKDLSGSIRLMLSTGAPLLPEQFDYVMDDTDIQLASISGGTDIISCFMLGNPLSPVFKGQIQGPGLGMDIRVFDEEGQEILESNSPGELVCVKPFPSMPVGFWKDPTGQKFMSAYFDFYDSLPQKIWRHGDFVEKKASGGFVIKGRSDSTLNPGGVRIGTSEIYRVLENVEGITDSIVAGISVKGEVFVCLFIIGDQKKPEMPRELFERELRQLIHSRIRQELTPRHVPTVIKFVSEIPYTRNGKKMELAVKKALEGVDVVNTSSMQNPGSIAEYEELKNAVFDLVCQKI